tara:strand:+ start:3253 stop:3759 length:507 start_codon:yes stop_codon:yes gene_type:complete
MIIKKERKPYPIVFNRIADELAKLRSKLSASVYKKGTKEYRGKQEHQISKLGIIAELIAQDHLSNKDINFRSAPLVDTEPCPEPDIIMEMDGLTRFDVKGMKSTADEFRVNYKSHQTATKQVDWYWFVRIFKDSTAEHYIVSNDEVDEWEIKELAYTKAYCFGLQEVQ